MGRLLPASLGFLILCVPLAPAADEPRALIEKALAAQGGTDSPGGEAAVLTRLKGSVFTAAEGMAFTGTLHNEPGGRSRLTLQLDGPGGRFDLTHALAGARGWKNTNGAIEDLTEDEVKEMQRSVYTDRVASLAPLLKEDRFTLEPLGESQVDGQTVQGVKVSAKGQPDVSLFFARESGLLVKFSFRDKNPATGKEALHETLLKDYREPDLAKADEDALKAVKVAVEGPGLLEFLKKHMPKKADAEAVQALIKRLGDETFAVREKAAEDLVALGAAAVPLLREAAKSTDPEVSKRAEACLKAIGEGGGAAAQVPAALRLVGLRRPDGAAAVLLDVAARAGDAETVREARAALFAVAIKDGKPDPAVAAALDDKDAARRALAEAALGKDGGKGAREPGRRLFPTGLKWPMKALELIDGQKSLERETVELQFFNRFEDSVFEKPK